MSETTWLSTYSGGKPISRAASKGIRRRGPRLLLRNQNFSSVFVVASAECSADSVEVGHAEPESISFGGVLLLVFLQVVPQLVAERVLCRNVLRRFKNVSKFWPRPLRDIWKLERRIVAVDVAAESNNKDAFAMLRDVVGGVDCLIEDRVAEISQTPTNCSPGVAFVM